MKETTKAALRSGLIAPGWGQWKLGLRKKGALMMAATVALLLGLMFKIYAVVHSVLNPEDGPITIIPSPEQIAEIHAKVYSGGAWVLIGLIVIIWIHSMVDAYREAKKLQEQARDGEEGD